MGLLLILLRSLRAIVAPPEEGWLILLVQAAILVNGAIVLHRSAWVDVPTSLVVAGTCGAVLGMLLVKTSCPDMIAHLTSVIAGAWVVGFGAVLSYPELGTGRGERAENLIRRLEVWSRAAIEGSGQHDRVLVAIAIAFSLWLVSYVTIWTLFRRRWLLPSLLLPGLLVVVTLGYSPELGSTHLVVALLLAGAMSALVFAHRRGQIWATFRIPSAAGISRRVATVGSALVAVVLALAWTVPSSSADSAINEVRQRAEGPMERLGDWWTAAVPNFSEPEAPSVDSYSEFGDSFQLDGGVSLSDQEAVVLRGLDEPRYLAGNRYNEYTGQGWESNVAETFNPSDANGVVYSPQITFQAEQPVALSGELAGAADESVGSVTILDPKGGLVFTIDTYLRTDMPTSVKLSWVQFVNQTFVVGIDAIPADLQPLVSRLLSDDAYGAGRADANGSPLPDNARTAGLVEEERSRLRSRFLDVRWALSADGDLVLTVTGQAPVYDDIEAVYARQVLQPGVNYQVAGLDSTATPGDLRAAGVSYPAHVTDRYLGLPDSVTQRTRDHAASVAADESNPFDIARAIEADVRDRITYSLEIDAPPDGVDVVDYVLFDSRIGYCEYHASAMAVMLRAVDIPARVVVGYHQVDIDPDSQAYVYRGSDAHAWVEAYFPGYGWIPFEPTPAQDSLEYGPGVRDPEIEPTPNPTPTSIPTASATDVATNEPTAAPTDVATPEAPGIVLEQPPVSDGGGWRTWVPIAVVGIGAAAAGALWFAWTRPYRGLSPAGLLIFQVSRFGWWLGVRPDPSMTPSEYAAELGRAAPAARSPARQVADLYVAERYGGHALSRAERRAGERALLRVRRSLVRAKVRRGRDRNDMGGHGES